MGFLLFFIESLFLKLVDCVFTVSLKTKLNVFVWWCQVLLVCSGFDRGGFFFISGVQQVLKKWILVKRRGIVILL